MTCHPQTMAGRRANVVTIWPCYVCQNTVYTVFCTQFTVYTIHYSVYSVQCTKPSTVYSKHLPCVCNLSLQSSLFPHQAHLLQHNRGHVCTSLAHQWGIVTCSLLLPFFFFKGADLDLQQFCTFDQKLCTSKHRY